MPAPPSSQRWQKKIGVVTG